MAAAWACAKLGHDGKATVPGLIETLSDRNDGVRFAAVSALGQLGELAAAAVKPLLAVAASTEKEHICEMATKALADIAPRNPAVQELLIHRLDSANPDRLFAAYGIGQGGNCSEAGVSGLAACLETADPYLVQIAAWAVGKLGKVGERATPALLGAMKRLHGDRSNIRRCRGRNL